MAVVDPEFLFSSESYHKSGALFWPDRYAGPGTGQEWLAREAWGICRVPYRVEPELESGQMVIDKPRSWLPLQLTLHLNSHSGYLAKDGPAYVTEQLRLVTVQGAFIWNAAGTLVHPYTPTIFANAIIDGLNKGGASANL